jgi:hypothetical protein
MARAILAFRLPEEHIEHADAVHGGEWRSIVEEVYEMARTKADHGEDDAEAIQWGAIRDEITRVVSERGLEMWTW